MPVPPTGQTLAERLQVSPATCLRRTKRLHALGLMTRRRIRHLPVVEDGQLIGLISIGDLVKFRVELAESEAEAMREYIQTA